MRFSLVAMRQRLQVIFDNLLHIGRARDRVTPVHTEKSDPLSYLKDRINITSDSTSSSLKIPL